MDYKHIYCNECGGVIGMFDRHTFTCETCGNEFALYKIDYDSLKINSMTGWIFPVKYKDR